MTLHSVRERALLVTPVRLALGLVWLAAATAAGAPGTGAVLAFAGGAFVTVFSLFNDPRARLVRRPPPQQAPPETPVAGRLRQTLTAMLPSTVGVSALAAISLTFQPVLTALLGGISAGLGIAGALYAARADPTLYVDPRTGVLYRR